MTDVLDRIRREAAARRAQYVQDLAVLIYKRVDGLSFCRSADYAELFAEALKLKKCVASPEKLELRSEFVHIPVCVDSIDYGQSIKLLLLLEELMETQMTVTKRIDTVNQSITFVLIEPIGHGVLAQEAAALKTA